LGQAAGDDQAAADEQALADAQAAYDDMSEGERADLQRNALLQWLDEELYYHILFRPSDIDELRGRIEGMSPTALDAYVRQTDRLRELMHTQEWQIVNRFYGYYKSLDPILTVAPCQIAGSDSWVSPITLAKVPFSVP
jgi:hypothetical protein